MVTVRTLIVCEMYSHDFVRIYTLVNCSVIVCRDCVVFQQLLWLLLVCEISCWCSWLATAYVTVVVKQTDSSYFYSLVAEIYFNFCIMNFSKLQDKNIFVKLIDLQINYEICPLNHFNQGRILRSGDFIMFWKEKYLCLFKTCIDLLQNIKLITMFGAIVSWTI